jgi:hypothetical protein
MLRFDPQQRLTIDAALAHPFLSAVRNLAREIETPPAAPLSAELETLGEEPEYLHANVRGYLYT